LAARKDRGSFVRLEPAGSRDVGFTRSRGGSSRPALRESRSGVPGALAVGAPLSSPAISRSRAHG